MIKELVLMAGGKGSRLGSISKKKPKCLIKIKGKTLLDYHIDFAKKNKISKIKILTNYKHTQIENYIKKKKNKVKIILIKDKKKLGTGGALLNALEKLSDEFLLIYSDLFIKLNCRKFLFFHKKKKSQITVVINKNDHPEDSNLIEVSKSNFVKKVYFYPHINLPNKKLYTNEAIFIIKKFLLIKNLPNLRNTKSDFVKDLIPKLLKKKKIYSFYTNNFIKDCGTIERIDDVKRYLKTSSFINENN